MRPPRVLLVGLLALAVLGEVPEIHAHDDSTPGFYNEECPLARLAVRGWGLTTPTLGTLAEPSPIAVQASPPTPAQPARPDAPAFAPRAPPATS